MEDEAGFNKQVRKICQWYHQAQELPEQDIHLISIHEKTGIQAIERDYPTQSAQMTFIQKDALAYLAAPASTQFDIVFLDPPFGLGLIAQSIELLDKQLWLAPYAKIYVETENTLISFLA